MKAVVITSYGGREVLKVQEVDDPVVHDGEVLIKVAATSLNRADCLQRKGSYPPPKGASYYPGLEYSGTVLAVGNTVSRWKIDDQLQAFPKWLALLVNGLHDEQALARRKFSYSWWSGIGTFAIQIAKHHGVRVFVTAGSEDKLAACKHFGADVCINYKIEDFFARIKEETGGKGVDVILDNVGCPYFQRNLDSLSVDGRLFIIGFMGGTITQLNLSCLLARRLTVQAAGLRTRSPEKKVEIVQEVEKHV